MSLTLYHSVESTCSQKVRFVLYEKQLQWQQINLNLRKGEQFKPEYLKLNRKAVVPTLVHDENVLRESTVIIDYLDDVFSEPPLKPQVATQRAHMRLLLKAFDEEVHPSIGILSYAIVLRHQMNKLKTPAELQNHFEQIIDPMRRERQQRTHADGLLSPTAPIALSTLDKVATLMEEGLLQTRWLAGEEFSLADATAAPYMKRMHSLGLAALWEQRPQLATWFERVCARIDDYALEDKWGSESFHEMVAGYVNDSRRDIEDLIGRSL